MRGREKEKREKGRKREREREREVAERGGEETERESVLMENKLCLALKINLSSG